MCGDKEGEFGSDRFYYNGFKCCNKPKKRQVRFLGGDAFEEYLRWKQQVCSIPGLQMSDVDLGKGKYTNLKIQLEYDLYM